jgi:hypothetical protein
MVGIVEKSITILLLDGLIASLKISSNGLIFSHEKFVNDTMMAEKSSIREGRFHLGGVWSCS